MPKIKTYLVDYCIKPTKVGKGLFHHMYEFDYGNVINILQHHSNLLYGYDVEYTMEGNSDLVRLRYRLKLLGITLELSGNHPWIYIRSINGKVVTEKFMSDHNFAVVISTGAGNNKLTDRREVFNLIRRYISK